MQLGLWRNSDATSPVSAPEDCPLPLDLHVCYEIKSTEFVDEYEPIVEGLDRVVDVRTISTLRITLTTQSPEGLEGKEGYMKPNELE